MLPELHGEPRRRLVLGPLEARRVDPGSAFQEQGGLLGVGALQLDQVGLAVHIVDAVDSVTGDAGAQLGQDEPDVQPGKPCLHGEKISPEPP